MVSEHCAQPFSYFFFLLISIKLFQSLLLLLSLRGCVTDFYLSTTVTTTILTSDGRKRYVFFKPPRALRSKLFKRSYSKTTCIVAKQQKSRKVVSNKNILLISVWVWFCVVQSRFQTCGWVKCQWDENKVHVLKLIKINYGWLISVNCRWKCWSDTCLEIEIWS